MKIATLLARSTQIYYKRLYTLFMTALNAVTVQVVVPSLFVWWLYRPPLPEDSGWESRANWAVQVVVTGAVVAFTLMVGQQSWTSVYIGALLFTLFIASLVCSFRRLQENWRPFRFGNSWQKKLFVGTQLAIGLIFIPASVYAATGYLAEEEPISLHFPLSHGVYIVGHGGDNPLINYHNVNRKQEYALDLAKLNAFGTRATGMHPDDLDQYAIYGDTLFSPCTGRVQKVVSDAPEYAPPKRSEGHPAGNHIVLKCKEARVHLAHMMPKSATVDSGDVATAGTPVGRVGNSGNTSEPHLHIHATRDGNGVPIAFNGRFLTRNSLVFR